MCKRMAEAKYALALVTVHKTFKYNKIPNLFNNYMFPSKTFFLYMSFMEYII